MRHAVVAVAQQGLRLYPDLDAYRRDLQRFFRLAEMKHARLVVFPERTGLMVIPPLVEGFRSGLLKKADVSRGRASSWWERTRSGVMRSTAKLLRADIARELRKALEENPGFIWQKYVEVFAALAYEYKVTVIAGSGFFPDVNSGVLRHIATVFGPDGDIIGQQAKVTLDEEEKGLVEAGSTWQSIPTPIGRLGIVFGEEVMYPEVGRVLAYQGVESLIVLAATRDESVVRQLHDGLKARVTDNQVFGAIAFTVGEDPFTLEEKPPFRGRSIIMAPHGLTPRRNGVLVESGSSSAEVLVTARWDFDALHRYWQSAPIPVRRRLPVERTATLLAALYSQGLTLEEAAKALPPSGPRALPREEPAARAPEERVSAEPPPTVATVPSAEKEAAPAEPPAAPEAEPEAAAEPAPEEEAPTAEVPEEEAVPAEHREEIPAREPEATEEAPVEAVAEAETREAQEVEETETEVEPEPSTAESPESVAEAVEPAKEEPVETAAADETTEEEGAAAKGEGEPESSTGGISEETVPTEQRAEEEPPVQEATKESPGEPEESGDTEPTPTRLAPSGEGPAESAETATPSAVGEKSPVLEAREEEEETTPPEAAEEEEGGIPEELWLTIKAELERAAATLRSLREPAPDEGPATESVRPARTGWFHRLLSQARGPAREEEWDEF